MGIYRSVPQNHVDFHSQEHAMFQFAVASTCGWKVYQQDFYFHYKYNQHVYCIGILDGHCGPQVAKYCQKQIPILLKNNELLKIGQYRAAIQNICESLDQRIRDCPQKLNIIRKIYDLPQLPEYCETQSGSSLAICLITDQQVVVGNIGQCKCYVSYKQNQSKAVLISGNHTQSNSQEYERVQKSNGFFLNHLVSGKFSFTRSIGDFLFKQKQNQKQSILISTPSVFCLRRQDLRLLIMGSSGFWQQPQRVLKQILAQDLQFYQLRTKLHGLVQDLIAKQNTLGQKPFGRNNITGSVVNFN